MKKIFLTLSVILIFILFKSVPAESKPNPKKFEEKESLQYKSWDTPENLNLRITGKGIVIKSITLKLQPSSIVNLIYIVPKLKANGKYTMKFVVNNYSLLTEIYIKPQILVISTIDPNTLALITYIQL